MKWFLIVAGIMFAPYVLYTVGSEVYRSMRSRYLRRRSWVDFSSEEPTSSKDGRQR